MKQTTLSKLFIVLSITVAVILICILSYGSGYSAAQNKYGFKLAPFELYTQSFYPNDTIIGTKGSFIGIAYLGYDSKNDIVKFWDEATEKPLNVSRRISDGNIVVFDPIWNNLQDRGFSISRVNFIKNGVMDDDYILQGNLNTSFYRDSYDNVPEGISKAYKQGYNTGLNKQIDYSKLRNIILDGGNLPFPYGIIISGDDNEGITITLTNNSNQVIDMEGIIPPTDIRNWKFIGEVNGN
jgi:hypothetical protein